MSSIIEKDTYVLTLTPTKVVWSRNLHKVWWKPSNHHIFG